MTASVNGRQLGGGDQTVMGNYFCEKLFPFNSLRAMVIRMNVRLTWGGMMEGSQIIVSASKKEVREMLASALSPEEYNSFGINEREQPHDPFEADQRGEALSFMTVLVWLSQAAAGGMAYDIMRKATAVLVERFGTDRVVVKQFSDD